MTSNDEYVVEILKDAGRITAEQIEATKAAISHKDRSTLERLVDRGVISEPDVYRAVASAMGKEFIVLGDREIPQEVIGRVPASVARRYRVVPVMHDKDSRLLGVALSDPLDSETLDSLIYILKCEVIGCVATPDDIVKALDRYYGRAVAASKIEEGDVVSVNFNAAQLTLSHRAEGIHVPCATGDSWVFRDCETGAIHHVSEGCTVSRPPCP